MPALVLVSMPFAEIHRPSIALGLLKAALDGSEIEAEIVYGNVIFAETIGLGHYQAFERTPADHLLGEWCFSHHLFSNGSGESEYFRQTLGTSGWAFSSSAAGAERALKKIRTATNAYLEAIAELVLKRQPSMVGCSSMFQQHCASLALLKKIRELSPQTLTLIGGANCEGEMGVATLKAFPWIDCVVSGEADELIVPLCRKLLEKGREATTADLPYGALAQNGGVPSNAGSKAPAPRAVVRNLDALPMPDYDTYFELIPKSKLRPWIRPGVPIESSRGCWWGEKSHCTFCGLNGGGMLYRSKSPERVIGELEHLSRRHGLRNFAFVDNILDMAHLRTVLPELSGQGYRLFYETKSNLKRDQVRLLAEAGVRWIQPGVESLHDSVLKLMRKGNTALINLQLMKWAREWGVRVSWSLLCGFPGELESWYEETAAWLPLVFHLEPPANVIRIRYDRFSPYFMKPEEFGLNLRPSRAYTHVYGLPHQQLADLAYFFEDGGQPRVDHRGVQSNGAYRAVQEIVQAWSGAWEQVPFPALTMEDDKDCLRIHDTRPCARSGRWTLSGLAARVYRLCDSAQTIPSLTRGLESDGGSAAPLDEVEEALEALRDAQLMLQIGDRFFSLALNTVPQDLPEMDEFPGGCTYPPG